MADTFTVAGSVVAFATAAFTLWDRLLRDRPFAFFSWEGPAIDLRPNIQVKNTTEISILILGFRSHPPLFKVSKGDEILDIVNAITDKPAVTILHSQASWRFQFMKGPHGEQDAHAGRIWVRMSWRKSTCTWLPQFPV